MADPVTLACQAPDASLWILAALGMATMINVAFFLALAPRRRARR